MYHTENVSSLPCKWGGQQYYIEWERQLKEHWAIPHGNPSFSSNVEGEVAGPLGRPSVPHQAKQKELMSTGLFLNLKTEKQC